MLHNKRKPIFAVIIALLMAVSPLGMFPASAQPTIISETSSTQTITQGVTLENIVRFTTGGWYNINIMRIDLSNPYIKVDTLSNPDSIGKLTSTKTLAANQGAVGAMNASFFTLDGGSNGHPLGTTMKSGEVYSASNGFNGSGDSMGSFGLTKLNEVLINYWRTQISLTAPNGTVIPVAQYNKPNGSQYIDLTIFDQKWGPAAVGATADMPDIVQMVVDDGKVTEILTGQPAAAIPQNGYVVVTRTAGGQTLMSNFAVGDSIAMDITTTPDWNDVQMAVTGASVIVKDGNIPANFSYNVDYIAAIQPRSVVASSKDGKQLIFVTVDGRQTRSIGMTQRDLAEYVKSIGAWNALNLDGGGSTTMVARPQGETAVQVMNSPSDGMVRAIATAIGVFTTAPPSDLAGVMVDTVDANIFLNTSRAFTVKGLDKYSNPMEVKPESIEWSVTGVEGTFKDNVFHPTSYGEGKITAKVGALSATIPISVLTPPVKLTLSSKTLKLPIDQSKAFTVTGVNKNGYSGIIDPADVKWTVKGDIGVFEKGSFIAKTRGTGYIDAAVGDTHAYCSISVSADVPTVVDNFEKPNGTFLSYPETVPGAYSISKEQFHSGVSSGKLVYDFSNTEGTRAVYMVLPNGGVPLNAGTSKLGLWVYNDHENSAWIRAEVTDSKGVKTNVDIKRNLDWTGWKYIEGVLDGVTLPAKVTRLYIVQVNPIADSGSIYLDDLTAVSTGYPAIDQTKIPKDTVPTDDANKAASFTKATATSFRFGVLGQSLAPDNTVRKQLATNFAKKIDQYVDAAVIVGSGSHTDITKLIKKKPVMATTTVDIAATKDADYKYSYKDIKNSRFFKLDMRSKSLRLSDSSQWQKFLADLSAFKGPNVFLMMENSPEVFSDKLELGFLKDTLAKYKQSTGKNVWVFYKGSKNESYTERGIKYISTAGYEVDGLTAKNTTAAKYVLVTVKESTVTYEFKTIN